jgi:hypothetical protein
MAENDDVASMLATLTPDDLAFLRPETREALRLVPTADAARKSRVVTVAEQRRRL